MKIIKLSVLLLLILYILNSSLFFYNNYYSCKWKNDIECVNISYTKKYWDNYYIDKKDFNKDNDFICRTNSDYCLSMISVIKNSRKGSIEKLGIKNLFLESFNILNWIFTDL